jgi:hypothetical protein
MQSVDALLMPSHTWQKSSICPAAVAIHNDGDMVGDAPNSSHMLKKDLAKN